VYTFAYTVSCKYDDDDDDDDDQCLLQELESGDWENVVDSHMTQINEPISSKRSRSSGLLDMILDMPDVTDYGKRRLRGRPSFSTLIV